MNLYKTQKGKIVLCNIGIEEYWNNCILTDRLNMYKLRNVEEIAMFLCKDTDICVIRFEPDIDYIDYMKEVGIDLPKFIVLNTDGNCDSYMSSVQKNRMKIINHISEHNFNAVAYAYSDELDIFQDNVSWLNKFPLVKNWNNKILMHELLTRYSISCPVGVVVKTQKEAVEKYHMLVKSGFARCIIKMPYGASGKGSYPVNDEDEVMTIARICLKNSSEGLLIEGYYEDAINYNYQIMITDEDVDVFFVTEQIVENTIYKGSYWGKGLSSRIDVSEIERCAMEVGSVLRLSGVRGVVGIDGILSGGNYYPAIDVNVRFTMSTFLSAMSDRFGDDKAYMSWMQDICTNKPLSYADVLRILEKNAIKYNLLCREGIIVYLEGPLPKVKNVNGIYVGRIYALCVANSYHDCQSYINKFNLVIRKEKFVI